jgi:toxin CptA
MLIGIIMLPLLAFSIISQRTLQIDVGEWGDHSYLSGIHAIEQGGAENYRWSTEQLDITLPNLGSSYHSLRFRAFGWRPDDTPPPQLHLIVDQQNAGEFSLQPEMRVYNVLLPSAHQGINRDISIQSSTYNEPTGRKLGFAVDWIQLRSIGSQTPALSQWLGQSAILLVLLVLVGKLALPQRWQISAALLVSGTMVAWNYYQSLWIGQALLSWLLISVLLLAATWLLKPHFLRSLSDWLPHNMANAAWALLIFAAGIRLIGSVHPLFNAHDIDVHTGWIDKVNSGQLYLYSTPGEFRGKQTFNPPAGYVLALPLRLLFDSRLTIQISVALLDILGCFLLLLIMRELKLSPRAALYSLALFIAIPINTNMLWWGFATNAMSQNLALILIWVLIRFVKTPNRNNAIFLGVATSVALITHVGTLATTGFMVGFSFLWAWTLLKPNGRKLLFGTYAIVALGILIIYLSGALLPLLGKSSSSLELSVAFQRAWNARVLRTELITVGFIRGFLFPLFALFPLGILMLWFKPQNKGITRFMLGIWLVTCFVFFIIDFFLGFVVRYAYFATPMVSMAAGYWLSRIKSNQAQRIFSTALIAFVIWSGTDLWLGAALDRDKPSALSLTH